MFIKYTFPTITSDFRLNLKLHQHLTSSFSMMMTELEFQF